MAWHSHLTRCAGLVAAALALSALLSPEAQAAPGLADHHWTLVGPAKERVVQLRVLVINAAPPALSYRVRFTAEQSDPPAARQEEAPAAPGAETAEPAGAPATPAPTPWKPLQMMEVRGGPLTSGASEEATGWFGESVLVPGKACRFRAELLEEASETVLAEVLVTKEQDRLSAPWLPAAALAALAAGGGGGGAMDRQDPPLSGWGTMEGSHQARRVGSEWVEQGQGVIRVQGPNWSMTIDYTYESRGPNAATLAATGTGTGTAHFAGNPPVPVTITSATAAIGTVGSRKQNGSVVVRTGCTATGTFDGTMGADRYRGVITMTNGTQTLDLATHAGEHKFDIQFTASK